MRKVILALLGLALVLAITSCAGPLSTIQLWESFTVYGAEGASTTNVAGNIMAVFYKTSDEQALFWVTNAIITDNGDGTWDVTSSELTAGGVNQALVSYGLYKYVPLPDLGANPYYLEDLGLQSITWEDLPQSMHVAALNSVAMVDGSPRGTVYRMYMGVVYEIPNCRVAQSAYDAYTSVPPKLKVYNPAYSWQAPENKDCFVLVYFISETPFDSAVQIPVIVDKVIK